MHTRIATDTSSIVIFDPARLRHRLKDDCDWWADPDEEIAEINQGNVLFLSTGRDGEYDIEVTAGSPPEDAAVIQSQIKNDSGRFFIGAGEYVSGGGIDPRAECGSIFVEYSPGAYKLTAWMEGPEKVCLRVEKVEHFTPNSFSDSPSIE